MATPVIVVEETGQLDVKGERERLLEYSKSDLVKIAEEMSLELGSRANKPQLVDAILEKKHAARANPDEGPGALETVEDISSTDGNTEGETATSEVNVTEVPAKAPESEEAVQDDAPYLTDFKHLMYTVGAEHRPESGLIDAEHCNAEIETWFERGYDIVKFMTAGHDPRGHRMIWVLEKVDEPKYREAKIIQRTLTAIPDPGRGTITGFQADAYISQLIRVDGWKLLGVNYNGDDIGGGANTGGVYMVWMLAR